MRLSPVNHTIRKNNHAINPSQLSALNGLRKIVPLTFIPLLLFACVSEINVPSSTQTAKGPVVKTLLTPDSTIIAYCSKVVDITSPFYSEIHANATIKTAYNRKEESFSLLKPGEYVWKSTLQAKDSFYFHYANAEDTFLITDRLPTKIVIAKIDTATQLIPGIGNTQTFTVHFKDSALYANFYRVYVIQKIQKYTLNSAGNIIDSAIAFETMKVDGTELPFLRNSYNSYTDKELLFDDETFNGVEANFEFYNLTPFTNSKSKKLLAHTIVLENITESLYNYYNTEAAHIWQQQSITQTPGMVKSNIPNGYGVVGGFTADVFTILYKK